MGKRSADDWDDSADENGAEAAHDYADQRRFSSETAFCPECGAEIYDAADICPKCFSWIDGDTTHRKPSRLKRSLKTVVVLVLLAVFLAGAGVVGLVQLLS